MLKTLKMMAMHLHQMNQDLNQNWMLRNENFNKDVLFGVIMRDFGDMEVREKNPTIFKYYVDIWWERKYRTFEKWWNAYDLSYDPLINNWVKEDRLIEENSQGNQFNKFKNNDTQTDHHIGDSFENRDYHNEYKDEDNFEENIDTDKSSLLSKNEQTGIDNDSIKISSQEDNKDYTSIKDGSINDNEKIDKSTKSKSDITVDVIGADYKNEHSGGVTGTQGDPGEMEFDKKTDTRKNNNSVSAYNSDNYEPSTQDEIKGDMGTEGRNTSTTHTHGESDDNDIVEDGTNKKDSKYNEINSSNEDVNSNTEETSKTSTKQDTTAKEIGKDTDDTLTKSNDVKVGENTDNTKTTANDKYINNSEGTHTGDSQQKNTLDKVTHETFSKNANLGVMTAQQMLESEIKVQNFDIYKAMAELFADDNLICIYEKGGCCCLW